MGSTVSRNTDSNHSGSYREDGAQLYVSLKMENFKIKIKGDLVPHVYGSERIIGSWDPSKAVCNQVFFLNWILYLVHFGFGMLLSRLIILRKCL
jgi:hypothetical protein